MTNDQTWRTDVLVPSPGEPGRFSWDLTAHELRRVAAVLEGTPDWNPGTAMALEGDAHRLLMSDLDDQQRAVHRMLVEAGVLDA